MSEAATVQNIQSRLASLWAFVKSLLPGLFGGLIVLGGVLLYLHLHNSEPAPTPPVDEPTKENPIIIAAEFQAEAGMLLEITPRVWKNSPLVWFTPRCKGCQTKTYKDHALFIAQAQGEYVIGATCWTGATPSGIAEPVYIRVVCGNGPQPTPVPPPPVPPGPIDPLLSKLRAAYAADAGTPAAKEAARIALVGLWQTMVSHAEKVQSTLDDLLSDYRAAAAGLLPEMLVGVRKAASAEISDAVGTDPDRKLDAPLRAKAKDVFSRLATALGQVR